MNTEQKIAPEPYRSLQILDELSNNGSLTQRDLSSRLGIALGLVNSYIKNLVAKGYITVKAIPPKRYAYYLTPKGFTEKTRLTYHLLQDYTRIYREARTGLKKLFQDIQRAGAKKVIFAGADEVAEIAYITLHETDIELSGVIDDDRSGNRFFGISIKSFEAVKDMTYDFVIITSYINREHVYNRLINIGIPTNSIKGIFSL